ncbi:MAG TPA: Na+/H+ antiporter [Gemmatimonadaceae bacterium]|jgi:CPA1 family monovalent cation:H+ antiporter
MRDFQIVLGLLLLSAAVKPLARRFDVPLAIAQAIVGLAVGALPFFPTIDFNPDLIFALLVPPLLYWAALTESVRDLHRARRPIFMLAVAMVLITMAAVAVVSHAILPDMPWAAAFVLGAIVSPPDAEVITSIARRMGLPAGIVTVLEGETLLNDTTAFVSYKMAIRAAVAGTFSLFGTSVQMVVIALGGIALGIAFGWVIAWIRRRVGTDPLVENTISLMTPFAAYLVGEWLGVSGVLVVVTCGLYLSRLSPRIVSARTRLQGQMMWEIVSFLIGGLIFTLIGVQLARVLPQLWGAEHWPLLRAAIVVSATVIIVRIAAIGPMTLISFAGAKEDGRDVKPPSWRRVAIVAWTGMRGGDTLVTALAIPLATTSGAPFRARAAIVTTSFGVIAATMIAQGLSLRPLVKWAKLSDDHSIDDEERRARQTVADTSLERLDELARDGGLSDEIVKIVRQSIKRRTALDLAELDGSGDNAKSDHVRHADKLREVEQEVRVAARNAVITLRDRNVIGDEALRRVQFDLDLEEVRISRIGVSGLTGTEPEQFDQSLAEREDSDPA